MNESYYVFKRYSLFRASVLAFTLPFFVCLLINIVNTNIYRYGVPWPWFVITALPFLFLGYKIKIEQIGENLVVYRCFINITLIKTYFELCDDANISWEPSTPKKSTYRLFIGNKYTGLIIDR